MSEGVEETKGSEITVANAGTVVFNMNTYVRPPIFIELEVRKQRLVKRVKEEQLSHIPAKDIETHLFSTVQYLMSIAEMNLISNKKTTKAGNFKKQFVLDALEGVEGVTASAVSNLVEEIHFKKMFKKRTVLRILRYTISGALGIYEALN